MKRIVVLLLLLLCLFGDNSIACFHKTVHIKDFANNGDDVTTLLQWLVDRYDIIIIDEGIWYISEGIRLHSNIIIKGLGASKSVIKRNDNHNLQGGMLFYTELLNPDVYVNRNRNDEYKRSKIRYHNISIEDLTIDMNRRPGRYTEQELKSKNLYAIALIKTKDAGVLNCRFVDAMTPDYNNGYPAVVVYQSRDIALENNRVDNISFLQAIYSRRVRIDNNLINSSVNTAIETIGGGEHIITQNIIHRVFWSVSCIGINSVSCMVSSNHVSSSKKNISCITLGHEGEMTTANKTIVDNNEFSSDGCRAILIQNGNNVTISNNNCKCVITSSSSELSSGCIVASGQSENIKNLVISHNSLVALGEVGYGCITYRGSGILRVSNNLIDSKRGISVFAGKDTKVIITSNTIHSTMYSIQANCQSLTIEENNLSDGIITSAPEISIRGNQIQYTSNHSYLGTKWERIKIQDNVFSSFSGKEFPYAFMLDASEKSDVFNAGNVIIKNNSVNVKSIRRIMSISGTGNSPQLERLNSDLR